MKITREFYIPANATAIHDPASDAVVYRFERDGALMAKGFTGKRAKPDWFYRFRDEADLQKQIARHFANIAAYKAMMEERKARRQQPSRLTVGEILMSSWGYDQTNVDFYQVTRLVGPRTVELRKIASQAAEHPEGYAPMTGHVTAVPGHFIGDPFTARVNGGNSVIIADYATAWPWDGRPRYVSWYA